MLLDNQSIGLVVTTSQGFSKAAEEAAEKAKTTLVERLDLVDGRSLMDILRIVSSDHHPALTYASKLTDDVPDFSTYNEPFFVI
jgi:hypothetical protein